jgi:hypothetical protein
MGGAPDAKRDPKLMEERLTRQQSQQKYLPGVDLQTY